MEISKVKMVKVFMLVGACFVTTAAYADSTISQTVSKMHYNEVANVAYVVGAGKWSGAASCPNATYITINPVAANPTGINQMLSIILAAQFAGKKVSFIGSCDTNPDYFIGFYVVVE
jgi:hypothetical protein